MALFRWKNKEFLNYRSNGEILLDIVKVGGAIAYLRKKIGYTQKELADRIGVSDKAVSKWERGLGLPDTAILGKVAILLDTDTDSLLAGDPVHHNMGWTGLLILEKNAYGINAGTLIYDKPIVYFLLSYFMLMGIRDICVVCHEKDQIYLEETFHNGERLGIRLSYYSSIPKERYKDSGDNVMIVTGMSFIYGVDQTRFFQKAMMEKERVTILSLPKKAVPASQIHYDLDKKIVKSENGEKLRTQYDYYQIPIMFCPAEAICKIRMNDNIDRNMIFTGEMDGDVYTVVLDRGFVEIPLNTWDDVMDASSFVKTVQKACGMQIYCIEEIAWRRGLISHEDFYRMGTEKKDVPCGQYILDIARSEKEK